MPDEIHAQQPSNDGPVTVPQQPEVNAPLRKKFPWIVGLAGIILLFGLFNLVNLITGKKSEPPRSSMPVRPSTANPQQVSSFETQQALQAQRDAQQQARQRQLAEQMRELQAEQQALTPGAESEGVTPMTSAQSAAIYGESNPNAPKRTLALSEAQAEAKQRALAREKQRQDAINSGTVAIDFAHAGSAPETVASGEQEKVGTNAATPVFGNTNGQNTAPPNERAEMSPKGAAVRPASIEGSNTAPDTKDLAISRYAAERAAAEAAKARAILQQQEAERKAEADAHKGEEDAVMRKAEQEKKKNNSNYRAKSKTWQTYVP